MNKTRVLTAISIAIVSMTFTILYFVDKAQERTVDAGELKFNLVIGLILSLIVVMIKVGGALGVKK